MKKTLSKYITHQEPFGPRDAGTIDVGDHEALRLLFDPNNKIFLELESNPSMVFGRRGSGKTSYLHTAFIQKQYNIVDELKSPSTFSEVIRAIQKSGGGYYFYEEVADLWEKLLQIALLPKIAASFTSPAHEIALIKDYLGKHGYKGATAVQRFLWNVLIAINKYSPSDKAVTVAANVVKEVTGATFDEVSEAAERVLTQNNANAILLIDSFDQYPTDLENFEHAMAGLLRCVGQFNKCHDDIHIRICFPSELYHFLFRISPAPLKDFSYTLILHWHAQELLSIAAHRLNLYLDLYYQDRHEKRTLSSKESVRRLISDYFPKTVMNGLGVEEETVAYILRHTQLLPRHLVMFLNSIFQKSRKNDLTYPQVSQESVIDGITVVEGLLTKEVISAYKQIYPTIEAVCLKCIPELSLSFSEGELHKSFNRHGKKASGIDDFSKFKDLLTETGIVGIVIGETDRYLVGRFEYTMPHKLVTSSSDKLCLHPVFAQVFNFRKRDSGNRAIYPYGSDPDGIDYREF